MKSTYVQRRLVCSHCHAAFEGTTSQQKNAGRRKAYCARACREAAVRKKRGRGVFDLEQGPCPTCGEMFHSRTRKKFCSMNCYTSSSQFKKMIADNVLKGFSEETRERIRAGLKTGILINCLECGVEVYRRKGDTKRKYCSKVCYRAYMAKRFDRWVADPQELALPQCYDEFLDSDTLPCLIEGCDWTGRHLGLHVNYAHGISAQDFKRAGGFNLKTGLVSKDLASFLQQRDRQGIALERPSPGTMFLLGGGGQPGQPRYRSLESKEHGIKGRALTMTEVGPSRDCKGCGKSFKQSTPYGRALYCTIACREEKYSLEVKEERRAGRDPRKCKGCDIVFIPFARQVWHSIECRDMAYDRERSNYKRQRVKKS